MGVQSMKTIIYFLQCFAIAFVLSFPFIMYFYNM